MGRSYFRIRRLTSRGWVFLIPLFLLLNSSVSTGETREDDPDEGFYDFTPYYISEPRFNEVYFAYLRGDLEKARGLLKAMLGTDAEFQVPKESLKFFLARLEMLSGKRDEALATLAGLSGFIPLQDIVFSHMAELHIKNGNQEKGYEYLKMVKLGSRGFIAARLELARLMLSRGEFPLLVPVLRDLLKIDLSDDERFQAMLLLARGLLETGGNSEASNLLYRVFIDSASNKYAQEAATLLGKSGREIGWIDHELKKSHRNPAKWAQGWIKKLKKTKGKDYPSGFSSYVYGEFYKAARKEPETALRHYKKCLEAASGELRPWCMTAYAETLRKLGNDEEAAGVYSLFMKEFPDHLFSFRALVESVHLLFRLGKEGEAEKALSTIQSDLLPVNSRRELHWTAGWGHYITGDYVEAMQFFERIIVSFNNHRKTSMNSILLKALYWKGKAVFRLGDYDASGKYMKELLSKAAFSYYGLLARSFLAEEMKLPVEETDLEKHLSGSEVNENGTLAKVDLRLLKIKRHPYLDSAVELLRLGFKADALKELQAHSNMVGLPPDGGVLLACLAARARNGGFNSFLGLQKYLKAAYTDPSAESVYKLVYPFPMKEEIEEISGRFDVPQYLIPPLIQFESGFKKEAVSPAGARGLMQLMPLTANAVLTKLFGKKGVKKSELHKIEINLRLGIAYLGELLSHFRESSFLSFLGYNAGPLIAKKVWKSPKGFSGEEILEETAYRGSATYIKKILSNFSAYSYIYGGRFPSLNLKLPETLGPFMKPVNVSEISWE